LVDGTGLGKLLLFFAGFLEFHNLETEVVLTSTRPKNKPTPPLKRLRRG